MLDGTSSTTTTIEKSTKKRGFASMTPEARSAIAKLGGIAAHAQGKAHEFTKEEAKVAGKKGGAATRARHSKHV